MQFKQKPGPGDVNPASTTESALLQKKQEYFAA